MADLIDRRDRNVDTTYADDAGDSSRQQAVSARAQGWNTSQLKWNKLLVDPTSGGLKVYVIGGSDSTSTTVTGTVNVSQAGSFNVTQGTSPWLVSQAGSVNVGNTLNVSQAGSFAVTGTVTASPTGTYNVNLASQSLSNVNVSVAGSVNVGNTVNVSQAGSFTVNAGTGTFNVNLASQSLSVVTVDEGATPLNVNLASQSLSAVTATANQGTSNTASQAWPIKPTRDISRTPITIFGDELSTATSETLFSLSATKSGASQTTSTTYVVSAGKILRLCQLGVTCKNLAATMSHLKVRVRQGSAATSPVLMTSQLSPVSATANSVGVNDVDIAEGAIELSASTSLCVSHIASGLASLTGSFCLVGYEYTP